MLPGRAQDRSTPYRGSSTDEALLGRHRSECRRSIRPAGSLSQDHDMGRSRRLHDIHSPIQPNHVDGLRGSFCDRFLGHGARNRAGRCELEDQEGPFHLPSVRGASTKQVLPELRCAVPVSPSSGQLDANDRPGCARQRLFTTRAWWTPHGRGGVVVSLGTVDPLTRVRFPVPAPSR